MTFIDSKPETQFPAGCLPTRATGNASHFDAHRGRPVCEPASVLRSLKKRLGSPRISRCEAFTSYFFAYNVFDVATVTIWKRQANA